MSKIAKRTSKWDKIPKGKKYRIVDCGRPAIFLLPAAKLGLVMPGGAIVQDHLQEFLTANFTGGTLSPREKVGFWFNGREIVYDKCLEYKVSFPGKKKIPLLYDKLAEIDTDRPDLPAEVTEQVNILIKYDGYISRQIKQVEKFKKLEKKKLPEKFDYNEISGLRIEAQQKLNEFQPLNIGQASRISGVTPADISVLLVYLEQLKYSNPDLFFKLNPDEHKEKQE